MLCANKATFRLNSLTAACAIALSTAALIAGDISASAGPTITLAPHRAVYDLKLARTPGKRQIEAIRGRILYDFSGNICDGYSLQFRQVSELNSGEGKIALSDLRAATWEDGAAKAFRFNSENLLNQKSLDAVDGRAERKDDGVAIKLTKPSEKALTIDAAVVFPADHMRRIIEAAMAGKTILEFPVYDGSETGEKVFNTLTVIGREIAPGEKPVDDAAAKNDEMSKLKRWPVTISYFDKSSAGGEQTPVYAIGFELYENGISRALSLDYGDFVVSGEMSQLDLRENKPCQP
jgi:hypothetical protein